MSKIRTTAAGYLYFDFFFQGRRCREYTELKNTPENLRIMNGAMKKIEGDIRLGTFDYDRYFPGSKNAKTFDIGSAVGRGITFREYAEKWYRISKVAWKPSVRRDFLSTMERHLIPYFGEKALAEITKTNLKEFRTALAELKGRNGKLSNKRINNILTVLRLILNDAADDHDLSTPFADFKPLSIKRPDISPFTLEEIMKFLNKVAAEYYNYYVVRFFTGMRTAEVDGLKWKYVDFLNRRILVRETWQSRQWVSPKTDSSIRDIDMSAIVEKALQGQRRVTGDGELVFCNKKGSPLDYGNVAKRVWYPTLKNAKLHPRDPYQSRHTAATLWLGSGENPEWVAKQLGHSSTQMLFRVYSKYIPNLTRRDGTAFERFLNDKLEELNDNSEGET